MPIIEYRDAYPLTAIELAALFQASGIKRPTNDIARLEKMLANADILISAWCDHKLVGVCRALTDFSYCCYLSDLAVDKSFQNMGVGRGLIDQLRSCLSEEVSLLLLSAPETMLYYPKLGFEQIDNGFIFKRSR